jgi:hypothetical protein
VVVVFFFAMVVAGKFVVAVMEVVVIVKTVVDVVVEVDVATVVSWADCELLHAGSRVRATPSMKQEEVHRINLDSSQGYEVA